MKVNDLVSILSNLDPAMDVKMYLFSPVSIFNDGRDEIFTPLRVETYNVSDVLVSHYGNCVLLFSLLKLTPNI